MRCQERPAHRSAGVQARAAGQRYLSIGESCLSLRAAQGNGAPQWTKLGTQIIGEYQFRAALAELFDLHFIVRNIVLRRPRRINDRLVAEMPPQRALAAFDHPFVRVDLVGIEVGHLKDAVA